MDDLSAVSLILILAVLLILDAIVYGFGTAVRMLRPQAEEDENEEGSEQGASREREQKLRARRQKILSSVMRNQADYADTIQLVTACVNMVVGAVYGIAVSRFLLVRMEQFFPSGLQEGWAYALSLILSWYEQKAVAVLLTLLHLGIKGIRLGPTLPAFVTPAVLDVLVKTFDIKPITTPDEDLKAILG